MCLQQHVGPDSCEVRAGTGIEITRIDNDSNPTAAKRRRAIAPKVTPCGGAFKRMMRGLPLQHL
jgi:hypothetical protein